MTKERQKTIGVKMMELFVEFGQMKEKDLQGVDVKQQVKKLLEYMTENFYTCTKEILACLEKCIMVVET